MSRVRTARTKLEGPREVTSHQVGVSAGSREHTVRVLALDDVPKGEPHRHYGFVLEVIAGLAMGGTDVGNLYLSLPGDPVEGATVASVLAALIDHCQVGAEYADPFLVECVAHLKAAQRLAIQGEGDPVAVVAEITDGG